MGSHPSPAPFPPRLFIPPGFSKHSCVLCFPTFAYIFWPTCVNGSVQSWALMTGCFDLAQYFQSSSTLHAGTALRSPAAKRCRLLLVYCKQMNVANASDCCSAGEYLGCFSWQFLLFLREKWPLPSLQWFLWLPMAVSIHCFRHGTLGLVAVCA